MFAILASRNKDKIKEINAILEKYDLPAISRDDAGLPQDEVEETGTTFEENSYIKAKAIRDVIVSGGYEEYIDSPVVADDSGLMVDALDGAPGVYSARYAGEDNNYSNNNDKLLAEMKDVPADQRTAHFVTVITVIYPDDHVISVRGECHGTIATEYLGEGGFGYDPVFIPDGYDGKSFSQLGVEVKNKISHRAHALAKLDAILAEENK